ncbi:MAG: Gfo/Idh/MocA family oxidoreductase [Erysipelotrichaceae bacterium]|nr:Gfo/Idh/MocA family oxidoreductase [Erysipelotrichaceae bacterium]
MINWGIIGLGNIARRFCRSLRNIPEGRLYAAASRQPDNLKYFREEFGAEVLYDDYTALLSDDNVDIVYIAVPHRWHYQWVMEALNRGRNVLCEKPAVVTCRETEEIFELARKKNLFYMEAMKTRCMPLVREIHQILDEKKIGDIQSVEVHFTAEHGNWKEGHYIWDPLYGGSFYDQGCYGVASIADYIRADVEGVEARCERTNGVDSHTFVTYRFAGGIEALCESSFTDPSNIRHLLIRGTRGSLWADYFYRPSEIRLNNCEGEYVHKEPYGDDDFQYEIRHVHQCLRDGLKESPLMNYEDCLRYVRLMELARERIEECP